MQRRVNVIGVGMSPFSPVELGPDPPALLGTRLVGTTIRQALGDAGLCASNVAAVYAVTGRLASATLQRALQHVGLAHAPLSHFPADSADGNALLARACQDIRQGLAESILVLGIQEAPAMPAPEQWSERIGATARAYMARYLTRRETFAMIAVKARRHAELNPLTAYKGVLTMDQVLEAEVIADPLTRPQFAWTSSGVAAVLLCSGDFAARLGNGAVVGVAAQACVSPQQVSGLDLGTTYADVNYEVSVAAARELYEQAGRGPQDIAVCELHDASTVNELLLYEALGFCPEGNAEKLVEDGDNTYGGNLVVNPSGGLLTLGLSTAAGALAQSIELVHQLRGRAGRRQVADAQLALQHQTGNDGTVTTTLFQRD